jgi:uncharacterized protein
MANENAKSAEVVELTVEDKLKYLFDLQRFHSEIDKIKTLRGELPLEVQDLEDEIAGLETRVNKLKDEVKEFDQNVTTKKNEITEAQALIKKYQEQQSNVRNNREYDSLSKEIEFQTLEIELCEKRIKEFNIKIKEKNELIDESEKVLKERSDDLSNKQNELDAIVAETRKEEEVLANKVKDLESMIEDRLLSAYKRIRKNARNGLAVVTVQRDSCGGCFNKIPPQRQLDIRSRKKIIVCEYCGRILVDPDMKEE